jgi:thioredoxin reductase
MIEHLSADFGAAEVGIVGAGFAGLAAALFYIGTEFQNELAEQIGCAIEAPGRIATDEHLRTAVEHVWAAGDVVGEEQLVAIATAQGAKAVVDIYRSLTDTP